MIKIILVDDEIAALEIMQTYLAPFSREVQVCSACSNIKDAIRDIKLYSPDLLLLDIELGDGLSFEILEHFPGLEARVIFVTAYDHYLLKAIKLHAFDYLFKPVVPDEFTLAVKNAIADISNRKPVPDSAALLSFLKDTLVKKVAVPSRNGFTYYNTDDIVYIEADGSYAVMHLANTKPVTVSRKVKDFEDTLGGKGFLRVHKSYLINIQHISELHRTDSGYLVMSNGARVPISPKDKEQIISKIKQASNLI